MPAQRLPWFRFWLEAIEHEKVAMLNDGTFRTWVHLMAVGARQPTRGRFASVQHAATITGRPIAHIQQLVKARLVDQTDDGIFIHDWRSWQDSHLSDFERRTLREDSANVPRTLRERSANTPRTLHEDSANAPRRLREEPTNDARILPRAREEGEGEGEGEGEYVVPGRSVRDLPNGPVSSASGADAPSAATENAKGADFREALDTFNLTLVGAKGYEPSEAFLRKVAEKYARRVDLEEEALKIRGWLRGHPRREASTAFVLNWLKKAASEGMSPVPLPENGVAVGQRQSAILREL